MCLYTERLFYEIVYNQVKNCVLENAENSTIMVTALFMWHYNKQLIGIMIEHVENFFMYWNKVILSIYHLEICQRSKF